MKKFVFGLEALLRHRKNLEDQERFKLSQVLQRLQSEKVYLEELQDSHRETLARLAGDSPEGLDQQEIQWFQRYLERLALEIGQSRARIVAFEQEHQVRRDAVVEASKKTKVLQALKARQHHDYQRHVEREEDKAVDEMVVMRFQRRDGTNHEEGAKG